MHLFRVGFFMIVIFEYEIWKTNALIKLSPPWTRVVKYVGDNYSIKCEGKGQKIWRNGAGQVINGHSGPWIFTQQNEYELILNFLNIRKEDKGLYNCSFKIDQKHSVGFELIVIQNLTMVSNATTEMKVYKPGDDVILECNTEGEPAPIICWFFNGVIKQISEGDETSLLPITNIDTEQDGVYTCRAFQKIRQTYDVELSFLINVYQKPTSLFANHRYEDSNTVVYGFRNESRNLTCAVKAYPVAYFVWYKDKQLMDVKRNGVKVYNDENSSILEILLDNLNVQGLYECEAANSQGYLIQKIEYTLVDTPQTPRLCYYERNDTSAIISVFLEPFPTVNFTCKLEYTKATWQEGDEKWKTANVIFCSSPREPNTNKIHCKIRNLQPLTKYAVRAAMRNPGGLGDYSNEIVFRTRSESSSSIRVKITKNFFYFCLIIVLVVK